MTFGRFLLSSILVSASFIMMAFAIVLATDGAIEGMRGRGLVYLALLPYLFGALLNKEGYWERSVTVSELIKPSSKKDQGLRILFRILRFSLVLLLIVFGIMAHDLGGLGAVREFALVALGVIWGGAISRAWFIFRRNGDART